MEGPMVMMTTTTTTTTTTLEIFAVGQEGGNALGHRLACLIAELSKEAIAQKGSFSIAISGGSVVTALQALVHLRDGIDFSAWKVGFVDERVVPLSHPDSNYGACRSLLINDLGLDVNQVCGIHPEISDPATAAEYYENRLKSLLKQEVIEFDVTVLGMGPDGHTASLFPGHDLVRYSGPAQVVSLSDSPKPPAERITLSMDTINRSKHIIFVATGSAKARVLRQILEPTGSDAAAVHSLSESEEENSSFRRMLATVNSVSQFPAAMIRPYSGSLTWLVDEAAVSEL